MAQPREDDDDADVVGGSDELDVAELREEDVDPAMMIPKSDFAPSKIIPEFGSKYWILFVKTRLWSNLPLRKIYIEKNFL